MGSRERARRKMIVVKSQGTANERETTERDLHTRLIEGYSSNVDGDTGPKSEGTDFRNSPGLRGALSHGPAKHENSSSHRHTARPFSLSRVCVWSLAESVVQTLTRSVGYRILYRSGTRGAKRRFWLWRGLIRTLATPPSCSSLARSPAVLRLLVCLPLCRPFGM